MGLIKKVVLKYSKDQGFSNERYDDLYGAAMLGAATALNNFDPEKNDSFPQYLYQCCTHAVIDELRKMKRWDNEVQAPDTYTNRGRPCQFNEDDDEPVSILEFVQQPWDDKEYLNPEEEYLKAEEAYVLWKTVADLTHELTDRQRDVLNEMILKEDDQAYKRIMDKYQCHWATLSRDKTKILNLLKERLNGYRDSGKLPEMHTDF